MAARTDLKTELFDFLRRNAADLSLLSDSLFYFGELGMQEHRSAELMSGLLEEHGFAVERGISGFPTAFMATYGSGRPVVALHTEYDALPSKSQVSGVAEPSEITPGAPGHCEGHNVNGAVMIAAAIALKTAMARGGLSGTLKIFGAPAEEQGLSRPYFVRDGYFDDVDLAFHNHILDEFKADYGLVQVAKISAKFHFQGESAHSAMGPWLARDALDAVVLMDSGMAQFREHMLPRTTAHRVIVHGGEQPNIIPASASIYWYFRAPLADGVKTLFDRARRIADGACSMTGCGVDVEVVSAIWPVRCNQTLAEVLQANIEAVGMPAWSADETAFARAIQARTKQPEIGLRPSVTPLLGPCEQIAASNDYGDISWKVPMGRLWFPANIPHAAFHHWSAGAALATSIAHKGALAGAQALAGAALDVLLDDALVARSRATFREEIGDTRYEPLLPRDQSPPIDMHADIMARFRPAMEGRYLAERPTFAA